MYNNNNNNKNNNNMSFSHYFSISHLNRNSKSITRPNIQISSVDLQPTCSKLNGQVAVNLVWPWWTVCFTGTSATAAVGCRRSDGEESERNVQEDFRRRSRGRRLRTARHSQLCIHERWFVITVSLPRCMRKQLNSYVNILEMPASHKRHQLLFNWLIFP